jgi:triacylglycerol lipase
MLIDFQNGQTFSLPAPYTLQAQFYTQEHFAGDGLNGIVPIAFVATSGNAIYVVFRGTKTISEWISDATLSQVAYTYVANGGKTETGFTAIYDSIRTGIIQEVTSLASSATYTTLSITGHSLGAALAVVSAPDLAAQTRFTQPIVYTFAGPRAGDPVFASLYNGDVPTTWRVVNTNDEVPKLPNPVTVIIGPPPDFKREFFFYEHVNSEYAITFGGPIHSISDLDSSSTTARATTSPRCADRPALPRSARRWARVWTAAASPDGRGRASTVGRASAHLNSSSSTRASIRSRVSNPSVNHP